MSIATEYPSEVEVVYVTKRELDGLRAIAEKARVYAQIRQSCARRCDFCNPPTAKQVQAGDELRQVLADALEKSSKPKTE